MANILAAQNGNWSATTTWIGGVVPVAGDNVYSNTRTITVDVSAAVAKVSNRAENGATVGGTFELTNGVTLTANIEAATGICVNFNQASPNSVTIIGNISCVGAGTGVRLQSTGTLTINGNVAGGNFTSTGVNVEGAGVVNITGNVTSGAAGNSFGVVSGNSGSVINITGQITGGSASSSFGVIINSNGIVNVVGDITGGTSGNADGVRIQSNGTLNVIGSILGNSTASQAIANQVGGTINVTGSVVGGTASNCVAVLMNGSASRINVSGTVTAGTQGNAIQIQTGGATADVTRVKGNGFGSGSTGITNIFAIQNHQAGFAYVREIEYGDRGNTPTTGPVMLVDTTTNVMLGYRVGLTKKTLVDPNSTGTYPTPSNVRSGISYASGNFTGTCAVPAAASVALGVAVDNTVGTAALTPASVWDYALSSASSVAGSVGEKLKKTAIPADIIALG